MQALTGSFSEVHGWLTQRLSQAPSVDVGEWQGIRKGLPQEATIEAEDVSFEIPLPSYDLELWQQAIQPNLPWAEDHFQERVSGIPHNPPPSHEWWPYAQKNNADHRKDEIFSHTYPERFWPQFAGDNPPDRRTGFANRGLRFDYGDLGDLVEILKTRTGSRQAYLPVWFPEDLFASRMGERVPCTLGYHFLIRNGKLKIVYYIRSCDFYRHFRDDVYMAGRLAQWVAGQIAGVTPTRLVMHISSLHIFTVERELITAQAREVTARKIFRATS